MGFDIYGRKAWKRKGGIFRARVWEWPPLAEYTLERCAEIIPEEERQYWFSNDGQRVSGETAIKIADRLDELIASGDALKFEQAYNEGRDEACENTFDVSALIEFAEFCRYCEGFRID